MIVHGGGPEITRYMERLGMEVKFVEGLRVSDAETVEVAKMVLLGKVNSDIVQRLNRHGQPAVGLAGEDGTLFEVAPAANAEQVGFVGEIERVDVDVLNHIAADYIPVIASVGVGPRRSAPTTSTPTRRPARSPPRSAPTRRSSSPTSRAGSPTPDDEASLISRATVRRGRGAPRRRSTAACGRSSQACVDAIRGGAQSAHIIDGRKPHSLLLELFTDAGHRHDGHAVSARREPQALEERYLMRTYRRGAVEFVRGEGALLWDADGKEYLDFLAGISVCSLGHCHPAVVAAVREQAASLMHVSNLFYTEPMARLAERLAESSLGGRVFFANSGTEANECAIKIARKHAHGRGIAEPEIVSFEGDFHGRTYGALAATPGLARNEALRPDAAGLPRGPAQRRRGPARGGRRAHRRGADRADPGRGRRPPDLRRGAARRPRGLRRGRRAADPRRDPDRDGADRARSGPTSRRRCGPT